MKTVNIVGAGLAGLSAALELSKRGIACNLISSQPSERAQSVLAEGGINAALNTMGEDDTVAEHFYDTMKGGCFLEAESSVKNLTDGAPVVVEELLRLGTPFCCEEGRIMLRNFGGQKKKRTAYAKSSTGKMIMTAMIDAVRKYEAAGLVTRYPRHVLVNICAEDGKLKYIDVKDMFGGSVIRFFGETILCTGGLNGLFDGLTTGSILNTANAAALALGAGAELANLEFVQYHPTTVRITGKRMLISEAARGEGGRLFIMKSGKPWYFMEEKYPELGNLMPRDVVSREMFFVKRDADCEGEVMLDMRELDDAVWENKLSDLRNEIISYMHIDPKAEPVPVSPGIHYFMGGIRVDDAHRTNLDGLFAAGEAACKYHGANRLGGNSMLGAVFGGMTAAKTASGSECCTRAEIVDEKYGGDEATFAVSKRIGEALTEGMGIVRTAETLSSAQKMLEELLDGDLSRIDSLRVTLGLAMVRSAELRKESRGAHYRSDFPKTDDSQRLHSVAKIKNGQLTIALEKPKAGGA